MNNQELADQLRGKFESFRHVLHDDERQLINSVIEALSAPTDEEVGEVLREIEREILKPKTSDWLGKLLRSAHQLIERLERENAERAYVLEEQTEDYAALEQRVEELKSVIAWANNSLYGSHGFFLSLNGGKENPHHLDSGIERLKAQNRKAERQLKEALEVIKTETGDDVNWNAARIREME